MRILPAAACGLAAGTLLACGSVLAGATHVGDGSLATDSASLLNPTPTTLGTTAGAPAELRADTPAEPAPAAPEPVRAQAVADPSPVVAPRLGPVRRNAPVSVEMPAEAIPHPDTAQRPRDASRSAPDRAPAAPVAPISPVLDPAARGVGQVAPVGGILAPTNPSVERADDQYSQPLNGALVIRGGNAGSVVAEGETDPGRLARNGDANFRRAGLPAVLDQCLQHREQIGDDITFAGVELIRTDLRLR